MMILFLSFFYYLFFYIYLIIYREEKMDRKIVEIELRGK